MVVVNVNPLYTPRELKHKLNDSGASAIVIVSNFAHTLEKVVAETAVKHVVLTRMGDQLAPVKATLVNFVVKYVKRLVPKYHLRGRYHFAMCWKRARQCRIDVHRSVMMIWRSCNTRAGRPASQRCDADAPKHAGKP